MFGLHLALCLVAVVLTGIEPTASKECSIAAPCDNGEGDCDSRLEDRDCAGSLVCGKNNCYGQFGTAPGGSKGKDDCCSTHRRFCSHEDVIPPTRRPSECCSKENPCRLGHGDCDDDQDCMSGLRCGQSNCKDYGHKYARPTDDCCEPKTTTPGHSKPSRCVATPDWRCCSYNNPCDLGGGDCEYDDHCKDGLVCGSNNCRKWHPSAHSKMDCCDHRTSG